MDLSSGHMSPVTSTRSMCVVSRTHGCKAALMEAPYAPHAQGCLEHCLSVDPEGPAAEGG
jgi:hypothetical protein